MTNSSSDSSPGVSPLPNPGPDVDRAQQMVVVYAVGLVFSILFVSLRIWCRVTMKAVSWDDFCMLLTAILNIPLTVLTIVFSVHGGTRHLFYLAQDPLNEIYVIKLNWIARPFGYFCLSIGKISIALLILRLLQRTSRFRKLFLHVTIAITILNPSCLAIIDFKQCENVDALWNQWVRQKTNCINPAITSGFALYASSWNTAMDFFLAFMSLNLVWGIQVLSVRKKIAICLLLGAGLVTGIISAIKTYTLSRGRPDVTYDYFWVYIWNCVELTLLIVLGCMPTLRPIYHKMTWERTALNNNPYYSGGYDESGLSKPGRKAQGYGPMDSDMDYPLVNLPVIDDSVTRHAP